MPHIGARVYEEALSQTAAEREPPVMAPAPTDDDDALLVAAASGDERAFEIFYRRYLPAVTGYHLRRTGRRDLAFDLTAETFAAVVVALERFDPKLGSPAGWLFGIAAHKLQASARRGRVEDDARRRLDHEPIAIDDADLERVVEMASAGDEQTVEALLDELPADQRAAIVARVLDEEPYDEIAERMACSEAVVRQRVHRG